MSKTTSKDQVKDRNKLIKDYLKKNTDKLTASYGDTAKLFNTTPEVVRHICRKLREEVSIPEKDVEFKITDQVIMRRENAEIKSLKRQIESAIKDYEALSDSYDVALGLKSGSPNNVIPEIRESKKVSTQAAAIIQISDGHFGKIVVPSTVNGLNNYNPTIARERMETCAYNSIKLIKKEREGTNIDSLVLILGGDFIENSQLHHHSEMTTAMSPMEETMFARDLLSKYINTVCEYGDFKDITISCTRGNHSRITNKMVASVDYRMNYEYILYNILKGDFSHENITWSIPDSEVAEVDVYGKMIRVVHGHQIKSQGGVGGIAVPLNKYLLRMDQVSKAHHTFVHHYHTLSYPTTNSTINGSVVGYDPYAMSLGCSYQRPLQSFQVMDSVRGITVKAPIFCD